MDEHVALPVGFEHAGSRILDVGTPAEVHGRIAGAVKHRHGVSSRAQGGGDRATDRAGPPGDRRDPGGSLIDYCTHLT